LTKKDTKETSISMHSRTLRERKGWLFITSLT
jgi:hypothetical protein